MANDDRQLGELIDNIGYQVALGKDMVDGLKNLLKSIPQLTDTFQKPLLTMGTSLDKLPKSLKETTEKLPIGFEKSMTVAVESLKAGMFKLDGSTAELAGKMEYTGESSQLLFKVLRQQSVFMKSGNAGVAELSKSLRETSDTYHISTTNLIASLDSLSSSFEKIRALGGGEGLQKAIIEATGMVGASNEKFLTQWATQFLDPTMDQLVKSQLLGVSDVRERALKGDITGTELLEIVKTMGERNDALVESIGGPGGIGATMARDIFGDLGFTAGSFNAAIDSMSEAQRQQIQIDTDFAQSWSNFKEQALQPFLTKLTGWSATVLEWLNTFNNNSKLMIAGIGAVTAAVLGTSFLKAVPLFSSLLAPLVLGITGPLGILGILLTGVGLWRSIAGNQDKQLKNQEDDRRQRNLESLDKSEFQTSIFAQTINKAFGESLLSIQLGREKQISLLGEIRSAIKDGNTALANQLLEVSEDLTRRELARP